MDGLFRNAADAGCVPVNYGELQLRFCINAHYGHGGHSWSRYTHQTLAASFSWSSMAVDVDTCVLPCIICFSTTDEGRFPRPFTFPIHGLSSYSLLQFDYVEIGSSLSDEKHVLMFRGVHYLYS